MRIDAHQHFWRYDAAQYGWITEELGALWRDFLPDDLEPLLRAAGVDGCIAVQARQDEAESVWLLELAEQHPFVRGVVGWVDLRAPDVGERLDALGASPYLVGIRHVVQDEPDERFLLGADFLRGVREALARGLRYDVLIYARQLGAAVEFADALPGQALVLDHLGKPDVEGGEFESWATGVAQLAQREHVHVKLSGLVTEADWTSWTPAQLERYLDHVLECFGPRRVMFGSDWPVCLLAAEYPRWLEVLTSWSERLGGDERDALFGANAARFYGLEVIP